MRFREFCKIRGKKTRVGCWDYIKAHIKKESLLIMAVAFSSFIFDGTWQIYPAIAGGAVMFGIILVASYMRSAALFPYNIFVENKLLKKQLEPVLEIQFEQNNDIYYQDSPISPYYRLVRIVIYNPSGKTINNIEVQLVGIEPMPSHIKGVLPLLLCLKDDAPPSIRTFDLKPHSKQFINVIQWRPGKESDNMSAGFPPVFNIVTFAFVSGVVALLRLADYKITIEVTANDVVPVQKDFNIGIQNNDNTKEKLWMRPV